MSEGAAHSGRWLGRPSTSALLLSALGLGLLALTWRTWPDPIVDFGREIYVPWRLSEGARLYRDIAYFNGPLSPWVNATLFRLFGVSLMTLVAFNLLVLAGVTGMLWTFVQRITDGVTALVASAVFLCVSGFGQGGASADYNLTSANYNFVTPYSHEATHGFALALLGLLLASAWIKRRQGWLAFAAGLCVGLAILTKPEMGLAALAATALPLLAGYGRGRGTLGHAVAYAGGAVLPLIAATALLATYLPAHEAVGHVFGGWGMALDRKVTSLAFYRYQGGLDAPLANLGRMLAWGTVYGAIGAVLALATRGRGLRTLDTGLRSIAVGIAVFDASYIFFTVSLTDAGRGLPLVAVGGIVVGLRRSSTPITAADGLVLGWSGMAMVLLTKMALHARIEQYGFVLAAPALALTISVLVCLGLRARYRGVPGSRVRLAASLAVVLGLPVTMLSTTAHAYGARPYLVGGAADAIPVDSIRGPVLRTVSEALGQLPAGSTLAVLPEGVTLNYLYRLPNPTPFINFMPPEVIHFHEDSMMRAFAAVPPTYILFLQKSTGEYGLPIFGKDYAQQLVGWVDRHYHPILQAGDVPFQPGSGFGALLLQRDTGPP